MFIVRQSEKRNGRDDELKKLVLETCDKVVPRLIGEDRLNGGKGIVPVVCHGDLWSGNASRGCIGGEDGEIEDVVYDPSAVYGHSEYDLGIMRVIIEPQKTTSRTDTDKELSDVRGVFGILQGLLQAMPQDGACGRTR